MTKLVKEAEESKKLTDCGNLVLVSQREKTLLDTSTTTNAFVKMIAEHLKETDQAPLFELWTWSLTSILPQSWSTKCLLVALSHIAGLLVTVRKKSFISWGRVFNCFQSMLTNAGARLCQTVRAGTSTCVLIDYQLNISGV